MSATAIEKFELAGRPYPPGAFENNSMLHKGHYSRIPDPDEKCDMMGIAADMVRIPIDHSPTQEESHDRVARSASLVGNSLNMPTIMLALLILLQLPYPAESKMWSMTHVEEQRLRANTWQTFWWPGVLESWPGVLHAADITADMRDMLAPLPMQGFDWNELQNRLAKCNTSTLQIYWADATYRGLDPFQQGPEWAMQQCNAAACASLGIQRRTGMSPKGLAPLMPTGMGPHAHMAAACQGAFILGSQTRLRMKPPDPQNHQKTPGMSHSRAGMKNSITRGGFLDSVGVSGARKLASE